MIENYPEQQIITRTDPNWDAYFRWPADYFPFNLPACSVEKHQYEQGLDDEATITWDIDYNLELEGGLVAETRQILCEWHPRKGPNGSHFTETYRLAGEELNGLIGFTFTWAFFIPMPAYMPKHPMGIIQVNARELAGKHTVIKIRDTRPEKK